MKNISLFLSILLMGTVSYGQRKTSANRCFAKFDYKEAASMYEKIYKRGDSSVFVMQRLGDCYYYNRDMKAAEKWYGKLLKSSYNKQSKDVVGPEYLFRYAQALKSEGKYAKSDKWLLELNKIEPQDSRGKSFVSNPDYFSKYSNVDKNRYVKILNVAINTKYSDFGTFIDGKNVFFASSRPSKGGYKIYDRKEQPFLNLYEVEEAKASSDKVNKIYDLDPTSIRELPSSEINTEYHEGSGVITKDGKTMYFTRDNYNGKRLIKSKIDNNTHLKLYRAGLVAGQWENVKELPFNSRDYSVGSPALSPDEKTLYFVSDMPGSYGYTDIYKVSILGGDNYGVPENLGKTINTEGSEMFPYVDSKGILYFSSDGHVGLGGLDIFKSNPLKSGYSKPINLGKPFNSRSDDFSFVFNDSSNTSGYFSSNRIGGNGDDDIYSFGSYVLCTESIFGIATDSRTKKVLEGVSVQLIDTKGKVLQKKMTSAKGEYAFNKIDCAPYTIVGDKQDYKSDVKKVPENIANNNKRLRVDLSLKPLIVESKIIINPIYFDFDKYNIREDAKHELEHVISVMENHPGMIIKIESYTDSRGTKTYNRILSDKRAKSTRDYIVSRGIDIKRILSAIGYGEENLLNDCDDANKKCTEAQHQVNRRSYFYIVNGEKNIESHKQ